MTDKVWHKMESVFTDKVSHKTESVGELIRKLHNACQFGQRREPCNSATRLMGVYGMLTDFFRGMWLLFFLFTRVPWSQNNVDLDF
jgi:hypothetical protein